jgi:L-ornithine N5-oxygenase
MDNPSGSERHVHDLICIGFGKTAIALAVALKEKNAMANTIFLERQSETTWTPSANLPSERIRTTFLNDLITSENPRSRFTFLNYLHATNQLVVYANSSHIHPSRELFTEYLRWCAAQTSSLVSFGKQVVSVAGVKNETDLISTWAVTVVDRASAREDVLYAKQVVCTVGVQEKVPKVLSHPSLEGLVLQSSSCQERLLAMLRGTESTKHFAIIGNGQKAAEVFAFIQEIWGKHSATWFTESDVLSGAHDSQL